MRINLRVLSVAVAVALAMLAGVQLADPVSLGITPVTARWLGIVATGLGVLATFLPEVQGARARPSTPDKDGDSLTTEQRRVILADLKAELQRDPYGVDPEVIVEDEPAFLWRGRS